MKDAGASLVPRCSHEPRFETVTGIPVVRESAGYLGKQMDDCQIQSDNLSNTYYIIDLNGCKQK